MSALKFLHGLVDERFSKIFDVIDKIASLENDNQISLAAAGLNNYGNAGIFYNYSENPGQRIVAALIKMSADAIRYAVDNISNFNNHWVDNFKMSNVIKDLSGNDSTSGITYADVYNGIHKKMEKLYTTIFDSSDDSLINCFKNHNWRGRKDSVKKEIERERGELLISINELEVA